MKFNCGLGVLIWKCLLTGFSVFLLGCTNNKSSTETTLVAEGSPEMRHSCATGFKKVSPSPLLCPGGGQQCRDSADGTESRVPAMVSGV